MIEFTGVKFKNFLATGDNFIEILLNQSQTTLITGHNGSGKTTILEAIVYALFGKPYRKVRLAGLINTVNKKGLMTEITFTKQGDNYKVIRGQKPNKFEIYKNDKLVDIKSKSKDYQAYLDNVIGMDYRLFTQIVILNKARFIPFLALTPVDRRKIVEDLLDIVIFSLMNKTAKEFVAEIKIEGQGLSYKYDNLINKITNLENTIESIEINNQGIIDEQSEIIQVEKDKIAFEKDRIFKVGKSKIKKEEKSIDLTPTNASITAMKTKNIELKTSNQRLSTENSKMSVDECPTCKRSIDISEALPIIEDNKNKIKSNQDFIKQIYEKLEGLNDIVTSSNEHQMEIDTLTRDINNGITIINQHQIKLDSAIAVISSTQSKIEGLSEQKLDLKNLYDDRTSMTTDINKLNEKKRLFEMIMLSLRDDGIKTKIIGNYLPIINEKINEYLMEMEFFIDIELDDTFNEKFNSPNRDGFVYENLSDGQKSRVDLAILMAWLYVAESKASTQTNLLFLDEILASIDADGIQCFMNLMRSKLGHKNLFCIEQRPDLNDYFRNQLQFKLASGFTEMV